MVKSRIIEKDEVEKMGAEEALRNEKQFSESIINSLPGVFFLFDEKGAILKWNTNLENVLGLSYDEVAKLHISDPFLGEDKELIEGTVKEALVNGRASVEAKFTLKSGKQIPFLFTAIIMKRDNKKYLIGSGIDITERKRAEKLLKESEKKYRTIMETIPGAVYKCDMDWTFLFASSGLEELTGFLVSDFINNKVRSYVSLMYKEDIERITLSLNEALKKKDQFYFSEYKFKTKDKKIKWAHDSVRILYDKNNKAIGYEGVLVDITKRKLAEFKLRKLNEELEKEVEDRTRKLKDLYEKEKTMYESSSDAIMILEPPTWKFTSGNKSALNIFLAKDEKDFTSRSPWEYSPKYQNDKTLSSQKAKKMIVIALKEGSNFFEWTHKKLNGGNFPATVLLTKMKIEGKDVLQATVRDITKEKNSEMKLKKSNRLKDLFMDIMRHDLLNPAGVVRMNSQLALGKEEDVGKREALEKIERNSNLMIRMIENASVLAKLESGEKLDFAKDDLGVMLRGSIEELSERAKGKGMIMKIAAKGKFVAVVNPLIQNVFSNFISNAIKYSSEKTEVVVGIKDKGEDWLVYVEDRGEGISAKYKKVVFDRFTRLEKSAIKGSGLGLAISKKIAEAHGGKVWVGDHKGGGSVFYVLVPKARVEVAKSVVKKVVKPVVKKEIAALGSSGVKVKGRVDVKEILKGGKINKNE